MTCGHVKVSKLEMGYGFGAASGWNGLGILFYCPRCCEVLWFIDDSDCDGRETTNNDRKRKENWKWKPKKKTGPHPYKHYSMKRFLKEIA